ncbi:unnamed protein product [Phytophthora fragariaefolia]|uniref:Unnamed protein product n=1 Tax=Phytophthora fragariaefolia TaxID=1490495 RepID=A0A9W7CPE7_9STRA|nr:unnamed protein product [Phytophthora fragariaefolia]
MLERKRPTRSLQSDGDSFKPNSNLSVLKDTKDSVIMPELPDGLSMEEDIEHRIDVVDPKVAIVIDAYYFSRLDLMSAYYQVRMKQDHSKYTVFQAPRGLYEYVVLPMGVSNAPAMMHRLTSSFFKGLIQTRLFYDDIYIFTKSNDINTHPEALRDVLEILKKDRMYVKLSKCVSCEEEILCLGDFIGRNGVRIDQTRCSPFVIGRYHECKNSFTAISD